MTMPTLESGLYLSPKLTPQRHQVAGIVHDLLLQGSGELSPGDILAMLNEDELKRHRAGETLKPFFLTLAQVQQGIEDLYAAGEIDLTVGLADPQVSAGLSCDAYMRRQLARKKCEAFLTLAPSRWPLHRIGPEF